MQVKGTWFLFDLRRVYSNWKMELKIRLNCPIGRLALGSLPTKKSERLKEAQIRNDECWMKLVKFWTADKDIKVNVIFAVEWTT